MLRALAILYGIVFVVAGVLSFIPGFAPNGYFLGVFAVNPALNIAFIVTGLIGLWVGFLAPSFSRFYFQLFGIVYVLAGILSFFYGEKQLLAIFANNWADAWTYVISGIIALFLGFGLNKGRT